MNPSVNYTTTAPRIGESVRVSMYNFLTGTVTDWDGVVTAHMSDNIVVIKDDEEGLDYIVPIRHVHVRASAAIAGA